MASGGGDRGREVFEDEVFGKSWPGGEVATFDCSDQGGDDGTEEGTMEKRSEISFDGL